MDIELSYSEQGEGFPLVLLHGNGENRSYFKRVLPSFAARYRVLTPDTRGHGETPRGTAPFTLAQFSEDLRGFFDARGITRAHLLGFSDGGNIALLFALKYPQYIEKLVIDGADLTPSGVRLRFQIPIVCGWLSCCAGSLFSRKAVPQCEMLGLMVTQPHIRPRELAALTMPVLVMAGTDDMIRRSHTEAIAAAIPDARLVIQPGDHFIAGRYATAPAFAEAVLAFLDK